MAKKEIGVQVAILIFFATGIFTFYFSNIHFGQNLLGSYLSTLKLFALGIGIFCLVPLVVLLMLQILGDPKKEYDPTGYYNVLKSSAHISFEILAIFNLSWLWALMILGLSLLHWIPWLVLLIPSIIILVLVFVIDALFMKYFKVHWYNFFAHLTKRVN